MSEESRVRTIVGEKKLTGRSVRILLFTLASITAMAAENPRSSVFVKSVCNGKFSSSVLVSFREKVQASQKYQLVSALDDAGRMGVVLDVELTCTERYNVVAAATVYGAAKCFGPKNCRAAMDGASLSVTLCDSKAAGECGQALFTVFDAYMSREIRHICSWGNRGTSTINSVKRRASMLGDQLDELRTVGRNTSLIREINSLICPVNSLFRFANQCRVVPPNE
jgi:hypothetical protein